MEEASKTPEGEIVLDNFVSKAEDCYVMIGSRAGWASY